MLAARPELRITGAAAQTRMVSVARIRLVSRKGSNGIAGLAAARSSRQKIAANPASASILPRSWHEARAAPPTVAARTRIVSAAAIRLITGNLCHLTKEYFAKTF